MTALGLDIPGMDHYKMGGSAADAFVLKPFMILTELVFSS